LGTLTPGRFASSRRSSVANPFTRASIASVPTRIAQQPATPRPILAGDESFPGFEPTGVVPDGVGVGVDPGRGVEIDERGLEPFDGIVPHAGEAGAAGPVLTRSSAAMRSAASAAAS
jgi:hypothetical protein